MSVLLTEAGREALAVVAGEKDLGSLAVVSRLRERFGGELAAAALTQEELRRKAVAKVGERARGLLFTRDGLEQASRADVAAWRAHRFAAAGVREVWDLGCGIGADALAFADAGLRVVGVERDAQTAAFAAANLGLRLAGPAEPTDDGEREPRSMGEPCEPQGLVLVGAAEDVVVPAHAAVYLDPARRDARGRIWSTAGLSPSWAFTLAMLRAHGGAAKVGPGIAHRELPDDMAAEWVSHRGDVVECSIWPGGEPGAMAATLLPSGARLERDDSPTPSITGPRSYLWEPDGAAIRAACLPRLARELDATLIARDVAYLAADHATDSPWVTCFEVLDVLPMKEKVLRAWVAEHRVGTLEIKKRGIDVDPATLRKALKPRGTASATLVLSSTPDGARALVCRRV